MKKEFRKDMCSFNHSPIEDFVKSQWQQRERSTIYLAYRWCMAIFFTFVVIKSMLIDPKDWRAFGFFFIYMTNWGMIMCMLASWLGAYLVTNWYFNDNFSELVQNKTSIRYLIRSYWITHTIGYVVAFVISIMYWGFIFNDSEKPINATNILTHILNSVFMFIDMMIVAHPLRFFHMFLSLIFGITYALFTFIYQKCGGVNKKDEPFIYHVTDWNKPINALIAVLGISLLTCCVHMILFLIYKLKMCFVRFWKSKHDILPKDDFSEVGIDKVHNLEGLSVMETLIENKNNI